MASVSIYPPTVPSYVAAFVKSGETGESCTCRLYYSLSKFSSSTSNINGIHISVVKQSSGKSVVNTKKDDPDAGRYRATGIIILNTTPIAVKDASNLYYVDILNEDIKGGWETGVIYKIQIRLSSVAYTEKIGQTAWLNAQGNNFSEWSTYCTTKTIGVPVIKVPLMKNFDSSVEQNTSNSDKRYTLSLTTMDFNGSYENKDLSETLYSYKLQLFDKDDVLIEDSGTIYANQYSSLNQFRYLFKHEFEDNEQGMVRLSFTTINKYEGSYDFKFTIAYDITSSTNILPITVDSLDLVKDNDFITTFNSLTSLSKEQEEGRIAIKLYVPNYLIYNGNICIRRADSRDNYANWTDIKIITCIDTAVNGLDMIYDYTVESGVWYQYGVQTIDTSGNRGLLNVARVPVLREWDYAYLLGEGGRQLKLQFDNTMNSYTYSFSESKTDTIGGRYPYITRNGNLNYRTFPINGLISFNMDENNLFTTDKELYKYDDVIKKYQARRNEEHLGMYDYRREFDFREKVLEFLQDGRPKLFKSSTEGNIIVRLLSVAGQPNQSLNRMIYSFSSTAYEIAEATMENYLKYGFYEVGEWSDSFATTETRLGQLDLDFNIGDNIISKIWQKYDTSSQDIAGTKFTLVKVHHVSIEFGGRPLKVYNSANEEVMGNNFLYNGNKITIRADRSRKYLFDDSITFTKGSNITVLGGIEDAYDESGNILTTVHVTVDFLYDLSSEPYVAKKTDTSVVSRGVAQVYGNYAPGTDIYNEIYYKFYYEWATEYRRLSQLTWVCIESNPGAVFEIIDSLDDETKRVDPTRYHEIGWTGVLNFENLGPIVGLKYVGMRDSSTGEIRTDKNIDVIVDYIYYTLEGTYKKEG